MNKKKVVIILVLLLFGMIPIIDAAAQTPAGVADMGNSVTEKIEIITSIGFMGNTKFSDDDLMGIISMRVGDNLTKEMIGEDIQKIISFYRNNGANLSISPNVKPGKDVATIEFVIDENGTKGDAGPYQPPGKKMGGPPPGE